MQPEVKTPAIGSVWGVPDKPETWRRIKRIDGDIIGFVTFTIISDWDHIGDWSAWLASSGAVDITELLAEAVNLRANIEKQRRLL